jgi:CDP-glucose 4,6-dehydratase
MEGVEMTPTFWRGRNVLLTGHTGFKGSWLSLWLQELGADLTGYALAPAMHQSLFRLARVETGMRSVIADVRDADRLRQVMQECRPEVVIHMAAQALVQESYEDPVQTYSVNVMGTVNLLEAVRHTASIRAVINVTTDKCYENREWLWPYRENEPLGGRDPYSSSKACAELVSAAYRASFLQRAQSAVALATARAGNVIGGGDWARDRLVPDIVAAFEAQQPAVIRNPGAIRPWQHVLEPLRGYLTLAEQLHAHGASFAEPWNFGPLQEDARTVDWIARELVNQWGSGASVRNVPQERGHEAAYLKLDISKAAARLDWHPVLRLPVALEWIVQWSKQRIAGEDPRGVTLEQLRKYHDLLRARANAEMN